MLNIISWWSNAKNGTDPCDEVCSEAMDHKLVTHIEYLDGFVHLFPTDKLPHVAQWASIRRSPPEDGEHYPKAHPQKMKITCELIMFDHNLYVLHVL